MRDLDDEYKHKPYITPFANNRDAHPIYDYQAQPHRKQRKIFNDEPEPLKRHTKEHFRADNTLEDNIKLLRSEIQNLKKSYLQANRAAIEAAPTGVPNKVLKTPNSEKPTMDPKDPGPLMNVSIKRGPKDEEVIKLLTDLMDEINFSTNLDIEKERIRFSLPLRELKRHPELLKLIKENGEEDSPAVSTTGKKEPRHGEPLVKPDSKKEKLVTTAANPSPPTVLKKPSTSSYTEKAKKKKSFSNQKLDDKDSEPKNFDEDPEGRFPHRDNYLTRENGYVPYFQSKRNSIEKLPGFVEYPKQKNYKVSKSSEKPQNMNLTQKAAPAKLLPFQKMNGFPARKEQSDFEFIKTPQKEHVLRETPVKPGVEEEAFKLKGGSGVKLVKPATLFMEENEASSDLRKRPILSRDYHSPFAEVKKNEEIISDLKKNIVRMYSPDERLEEEDRREDEKYEKVFGSSIKPPKYPKPQETKGMMLLQEVSELYRQSLNKMQEIKETLRASQTNENHDYPLRIVIEGSFYELKKKEENILSALRLLEDEEDPIVIIPAQTMQTNMLMFREIMEALEDRIFARNSAVLRGHQIKSQAINTGQNRSPVASRQAQGPPKVDIGQVEGSNATKMKPPKSINSSKFDEEKLKMASKIEELQEKVRQLEKIESEGLMKKSESKPVHTDNTKKDSKEQYEKNFFERVAERLNHGMVNSENLSEKEPFYSGSSMAYSKIRREQSMSPDGPTSEPRSFGSNSTPINSKHEMAKNNYRERAGENSAKVQKEPNQKETLEDKNYRVNKQKIASRLNRYMFLESKDLDEGGNNEESKGQIEKLRKLPSFGDEIN